MEKMLPTDWRKVDNFQPSEFLCPCGCGKGPFEMFVAFIVRLELARQDSSVPFIINSGYRCPSHNGQVGGVIRSSHIMGLAADISTVYISPDLSLAQVRFIILLALMPYFDRIGIGQTYIHVDCDPDKPKGLVWLYD